MATTTTTTTNATIRPKGSHSRAQPRYHRLKEEAENKFINSIGKNKVVNDRVLKLTPEMRVGVILKEIEILEIEKKELVKRANIPKVKLISLPDINIKISNKKEEIIDIFKNMEEGASEEPTYEVSQCYNE